MKYILFPLIFISSIATAHAADLKIQLTDIRNDKGDIAIAIYDNATAFTANKTDEAPYTMLFKATGTKTLTLHDLPAGTYAIAILHDENRNGTLDTNKRQFPIEGYAYSNNVGKMSVPTFKKASFVHLGNTDTTQSIQMVYIK